MLRLGKLISTSIVGCTLAGLSLTMICGCGGGGGSATTTQPTEAIKFSGKEELKKRLAGVAETGAGGSGLAGMREAIMELKASDAALGDQLLIDLTQLESLQDAEQIKALAKQMADKL